jgi:hypothetical protein
MLKHISDGTILYLIITFPHSIQKDCYMKISSAKILRTELMRITVLAMNIPYYELLCIIKTSLTAGSVIQLLDDEVCPSVAVPSTQLSVEATPTSLIGDSSGCINMRATHLILNIFSLLSLAMLL